MPFVKGIDLKKSAVDQLNSNSGEFSLVKPDVYYYCQFRHLFEEEGEREKYEEDDVVIYTDSEYSFYEPLLWGNNVRRLYPEEAYLFIFEHEVRDGVDVNEIVKRGDAKYLTKEEFEDLVERYVTNGTMFATETMISSRHQNPKLWDSLMKQRSIETQMVLNRLLPDIALSKQIESSLRQ